MIWFLSDLHLGHKSVAEMRGFDSVEEHDAEVLGSIARTTKMRGELWLLGDVFWGRVRPECLRLMPQTVELILGNHDDALRGSPLFRNTRDMAFIKPYGQKIHLCHYPLSSWRSSHYGAWHLHGHSHGSGPNEIYRNKLDISWESFKRPISFEEIREIFNNEGKNEKRKGEEEKATRCDNEECEILECENFRVRGEDV